MKIAVDIDDTITNTKQEQIKLWKEYYINNPKPGYSEELPALINEWGDEYINDFWDLNREHLSFHSPYKENVGLIIEKLRNDGHTVCIVTSRPKYKYDGLISRINKALIENNIEVDNIFTDAYDKGSFCKEHNFDLLIDDDIKHILSAQKHGLKAILFNNNSTYAGTQTTTWEELYDIIKSAKF